MKPFNAAPGEPGYLRYEKQDGSSANLAPTSKPDPARAVAHDGPERDYEGDLRRMAESNEMLRTKLHDLEALYEEQRQVLAAIRAHPLGRNAAVVATAVAERPGSVILDTGFGRRMLAEPEGELLPRIC